jgi:hypothetical protein
MPCTKCSKAYGLLVDDAPVFGNCGHDFCRGCIEGPDNDAHRFFVDCPVCKKRIWGPFPVARALIPSHTTEDALRAQLLNIKKKLQAPITHADINMQPINAHSPQNAWKAFNLRFHELQLQYEINARKDAVVNLKKRRSELCTVIDQYLEDCRPIPEIAPISIIDIIKTERLHEEWYVAFKEHPVVISPDADVILTAVMRHVINGDDETRPTKKAFLAHVAEEIQESGFFK